MPIRPENMAKYPGGSIRSAEWLAIRRNIQFRARNCCENCGVENGSIGGRDEDGNWYDVADPEFELGSNAFCANAEHGERDLRLIKIVCTVAHRDGRLDDHSDANLAFWCQRCHLRHDAAQHQANAAITRHEKAGQLDLLGRA